MFDVAVVEKEHLWEFRLRELNSGEELDFAELRGDVVLLVNVASFCGKIRIV